ncbi:MAG: metallophosphoesterase family protein [Kiritimatiellia bacterium]
MNLSRRFFIGGATAFGAFGGSRFFAASAGTAPAKRPNLKFGVVSDIHITCVGADQKMEQWGNNLTFRHTLEWFRDQGVDAVMVVGDMADTGMVDQLQAVAQAWYAVFPGDKAPDGRKVEKLFVYGNHDYHGYLYGDFAAKRHAKEARGATFGDWSRDHVLRADLGGWWKNIFHEDYSRFYKKEIKGYTFLGQHWDDGKGMETKYGGCPFGVELKTFLDAQGGALDPARPFFYFQHPHPKNTCYGPWAWGHDAGLVTRILSSHPNAIAFSGHSHYSLTDERTIWQGAFTSVGTSSLRYTGLPYNERLPLGYENTTTEGQASAANNALKVMGDFNTADGRQGMLWSVYDDCIVVQRREFLGDAFLGPDWVMPLPVAEAKPFDFAVRAKKATAPAFPKDAKVVLRKLKAKTRRTPGHEPVEKDAYELTFPAALAAAGTRPYEYEIVAHGAGGATQSFFVVAEGYHQPISHKRATANSSCRVAVDRLPAGVTHFTVIPMDCWHNKGAALTVKV